MANNSQYKELSYVFENFRNEWGKMDFREFEKTAIEILSPLIRNEFDRDTAPFVKRANSTIDFSLTEMAGVGLGLEVKKGFVNEDIIFQARGLISTYNDLDRIILFSPSGFSPKAISLAQTPEPITIELIDLERLTAWIEKLRVVSPQSKELNLLQAAIKDLSIKLVEIVASDPDVLDRIEWRDYERMLAAALDGLGFEIELTPPAKDGGRDIVLRCHVFGVRKTYFIELKHWFSPVGRNIVQNFVKVVLDEQVDHGFIIATTGYTKNAFEGFTEFERRKISGKNASKSISICQEYVRVKAGLYVPEYELPKLLYY